MSGYSEQIRVHTDADPERIEELMRIRHHTLDHLTPSAFAEEVSIAEEALEIMREES